MNIQRAHLGDHGLAIRDQKNPLAEPLNENYHDDGDTGSIISFISCMSDHRSESLQRIPYTHVLWCENATDYGSFNSMREPSSTHASVVRVSYVASRKDDLVPVTALLSVESFGYDDVAAEVMARAYPHCKPQRRILVLINPYGGQGKARKLYDAKVEPIFSAAHVNVDVMETRYNGHAIDIAKEIDVSKYDVIACASGDGIPHEVFNGLYMREDRATAFNSVAVVQIPCGSGNAMSLSCFGTREASHAAFALVKAVKKRLDLMAVTQNGRTKVSFLTQTYGVVAESDINTEFIRFMGPVRFDIGVMMNVLSRKRYPCKLYVKYLAKSKDELRAHYNRLKSGSIVKSSNISISSGCVGEGSSSRTCAEDCGGDADPITEDQFTLKEENWTQLPPGWEEISSDVASNVGIFYTGKMPYISPGSNFFPAALPADGAIDLVITDARTSLSRMAPILMGVERGTHVLQPEVIHSKVVAFRLIPLQPNSVISIDGENFPYETLQVEVLHKCAYTLLKDGDYVDTGY